jgi:putative heme-binding domain-containing protein
MPVARRGLLIGGVLSAALFVVTPPVHAQQPAAGAPACADPLHTTGPCPSVPGPGAGAGGDAVARGKAIFEGKGACQSCHRVSAVGSRVGPDLTSIGGVLSADSLTKALIDPNAALRPTVRSVRAVTKDGKVVVGLRLNEDRYTVQFIDEQERLRTVTKSNLREYAILTTARMPSYREKLTPSEIADVVSYLRSLKNP